MLHSERCSCGTNTIWPSPQITLEDLGAAGCIVILFSPSFRGRCLCIAREGFSLRMGRDVGHDDPR